MVIAILNIKGGVGKTTIAVNIVVALTLRGHDVLLVDGDEQRTATDFTDMRGLTKGTPGYAAISLRGAAIRTQTALFAPKHDHVVIDIGGRDTAGLRAAMLASDVVYVPVLPSSFDIWSFDQMAHLLKEAQQINAALRFCSGLNQADARGKDNETATELMKKTLYGMFYGMPEIAPPLVRRKAFSSASSRGLSVLEWNDAKASEELRALADFLLTKKVA